jgi:hypothetical protein
VSDVARCRCPIDSAGAKCGRNVLCPIHGDSPKDPVTPWVLNDKDRAQLKAMRIATTDSEDIQQVRQADEDRFRRD